MSLGLPKPGYMNLWYEFRHTPTTMQCGGARIYVKSCYKFDIKDDLSQSISDVTESIFIELEREGKKNLLIGCIYRHHCPIPTFLSEYFKSALDKVSKQKNKLCAFMGDFNVDLKPTQGTSMISFVLIALDPLFYN